MRKRKQILDKNIKELTKSFVLHSSLDLNIDEISHKIWLEVLEKNGYLSQLCESGSMLVIGTSAMGASSVLKWIVSTINKNVKETHQMGFYYDINEALLENENTFPEIIYQKIIIKMFESLLSLIENNLTKKNFLQSRLLFLKNTLNEKLDNNIIDMPLADISKVMNDIFNILGIDQVKLCLDNISNLHTHQLAFLLHLLMRTFEKTGKYDLVISGILDQLILMTDTPQGPVGLQFGHDIFLGLNLEELLLPQTDKIANFLDFGIRSEYLNGVLEYLGFSLDKDIYGFKDIFTTPNTWKSLFHLMNGNLDQIMHAIPIIMNWYKDNKKKISINQLAILLKPLMVVVDKE